MLKVLAFYLFIWWFVKFEDKKIIIIRAVLASALAITYFIGAICFFTEPRFIKDGVSFVGVFCLIPAILFGLRAIFDIKKLLSIKNDGEKVDKGKSTAISENGSEKLPLFNNTYISNDKRRLK